MERVTPKSWWVIGNSRFSRHTKNIGFLRLTRWCELLPTIQSTLFRVQPVYKGMPSAEDCFRVTVLQPSWHSQKQVLSRGWEAWLVISFRVISISSQMEVSNLPSIQQKIAFKGPLWWEHSTHKGFVVFLVLDKYDFWEGFWGCCFFFLIISSCI